ncbi:hypothetical protein GCM10010503_51860 [Streptomyces lucensis JCM 4490]|uniref:Uncharacterized protein n=2 Tax=Streptomyces lucensis TaxID=67319 RepID=A0A918JDW2_9ACTN|nr:hypothetical protein GCM10010503_51860 [Streptomyces lucensis JCM 4490]
MLHRRTPDAVTRVWAADTVSAQAMPASPVPALAAGASTARIPADPADAARRAATGLRRRLAGLTARADRALDRRPWAELARGYLALALSLVPRARPRHTLTVFVASLTERPAAPGPPRPCQQVPRPPQDRPEPGPDATP